MIDSKDATIRRCVALFRITLIHIVCSLVRDKDDALARAHSNLAEVETLQDKIGNYRENIQVCVL